LECFVQDINDYKDIYDNQKPNYYRRRIKMKINQFFQDKRKKCLPSISLQLYNALNNAIREIAKKNLIIELSKNIKIDKTDIKKKEAKKIRIQTDKGIVEVEHDKLKEQIYQLITKINFDPETKQILNTVIFENGINKKIIKSFRLKPTDTAGYYEPVVRFDHSCLQMLVNKFREKCNEQKMNPKLNISELTDILIKILPLPNDLTVNLSTKNILSQHSEHEEVDDDYINIFGADKRINNNPEYMAIMLNEKENSENDKKSLEKMIKILFDFDINITLDTDLEFYNYLNLLDKINDACSKLSDIQKKIIEFKYENENCKQQDIALEYNLQNYKVSREMDKIRATLKKELLK